MTAFAPASPEPGRLSAVAGRLVGSEILKIAADVRAMREGGARVRDFTVGDFDPAQFRIPPELCERIQAALARGHTNYPPSSGVRVLREAVADDLERAMGVRFGAEQILVTGGSRPGIYGTYRTLVDPGDRVVYPAPSWNNNHYCALVGAVGVPVPCRPEDAFLPTREVLEPAVRGARLLALNSPLNPAGTSFTAEQLGAICDLVVEENERRPPNERPLYVLYDQVYRALTFGGVAHVDPVGLRPAMAPYTVYVDGVSKSLAATGVRVGWVAGPADAIGPMSSMLGHVGAWAPHAEQVATAEFLADRAALEAHRRHFVAGVEARLRPLHAGVEAMRRDGLPVEAVAPTGAIYLSVRVALAGRRAPGGARLDDNEGIRRHLLDSAGIAVVPFQAFAMGEESGWFRLSVGAVSVRDVEETIPQLRAALGG